MSKEKKTLIVAVVLLLVAVCSLAVSVYAKYASLLSGTGPATVAKWAFETDNQTDVVECPITNYDESTLVNGKIAPGTAGTCTIELSNANSEVGVEYTIKLSSITNQPTNLKFYKTKNGTNYSNPLTTTSGTVTGTIAPQAASSVTETIYWVWPYETGTDADDVADTTDGVAANTMNITFEISGVQTEPTE